MPTETLLAWNAPQRFELLELRLLGPETLEWAQDANRWLPNRLTKYWNRPSRKFPWSFSESEKRFTLDANIMDNDRLEWTAGLITKRIQTSEPPLDIILGSFDSQPNDLSYIRLLTISLNKASGMLILTSHLPNKLKLLDNGKWIPMHPESGRAIYSRDRNLFSAFTLFQYKLSFCSVDSLSTQDMDIVRDTLFQPEDAALMKRASTFPPSPMLVRVGNILICQPLYQRELDMRSHGIDLDGGNFVLVKETVVRTESEREMIVDEGKLGQELEDVECITAARDQFCFHRNSVCSETHDKYWTTFEHGLGTFGDFNFVENGDQDLDKVLLRMTLSAAKSLHDRNILHRDIRLGNMLVLCTSPREAVRASLVLNTRTAYNEAELRAIEDGLTHNRAPETFLGEWTTASDLWAWGYGAAELVVGYRPSSEDPITETRLQELRGTLHIHGQQNPRDQPFVDLLLSLLVWEPGERITVDDALYHPCWHAGNLIAHRLPSDGPSVHRWWKSRFPDHQIWQVSERAAERPKRLYPQRTATDLEEIKRREIESARAAMKKTTKSKEQSRVLE